MFNYLTEDAQIASFFMMTLAIAVILLGELHYRKENKKNEYLSTKTLTNSQGSH